MRKFLAILLALFTVTLVACNLNYDDDVSNDGGCDNISNN